MGRILEEMNFQETSELTSLNLGSLGVKVNLPLIERHSPLAYSIAEHIHWDLARHRGIETCNRMCLENVCILQSATLFKEFSDDCIRCKMKRKRYLEASMGPISDSQLSLAPACWMVQVDLFGPIHVYVPGFERNTRNRQVLQAKCWVMTAVCPTTRLINLQTMESSKAAGWLDAFTRLCCEVGTPKHVFLDQDSAGMSAFQIAELELRDLQLRLHREKGISFTVCGVGGHDRHGQVERVIRSVQEGFRDCGLGKVTLHATGLQTLCKLVETQYNNLPIGFHHSRAADNTPLLKMLTPNMLRTGRINQRSLDGPVRIPENRKEILKKVDETYSAWFKIWLNTLVPKLMFAPKWFRTDKDLELGNLVYFQKDPDTTFDTKWVVGKVDEIERSRDGIIRMVTVKYFNGQDKTPQYTKRTVRKLVKLWSVDDISLAEDIAEMTRKFGEIQGLEATRVNEEVSSDRMEMFADQLAEVQSQGELRGGEDQLAAEEEGDVLEGNRTGHASSKVGTQKCDTCCCASHHQYSMHYAGNKFKTLPGQSSEGMENFILMEEKTEQVKGRIDSLEEVMMSAQLNLDNLF